MRGDPQRQENERRQRDPIDLPRLFQKERPRGRGLEPARAAQRPDADVHQFGHGAVQERLHRHGEAALHRATTAQKSVRAGGKHNDLDNVGYTARHLTFFEMLGNFSFGDYFKERAIELAWNLITKDFGLPKDKLLVTVYHTDDQAFDLWKKIAGFSDDRIIRIPTSTISGRWAIPVRAVRARKSSLIAASTSGAARPAARRRMATGSSSSGTSSSCSMSRSPSRSASTCRALDRYRHGAGAHGVHPAGRRERVRDGPVPPSDRRDGVRARSSAERRRRLRPTASSPTILRSSCS
jgi:hypothetical protein